MNRFTLLGIWLVCLMASVLSGLRMLYSIATNPAKARSIALAYDRLANVATNGQPAETVSSRANRARTEGRRWGCVLCRVLDSLDPGHCQKSAE